MLRAGSAVAGLERGGHDFEPAKTAVSKLGLGLKRRSPLRLRPISPLSPPLLRQLLLSIIIFEQGNQSHRCWEFLIDNQIDNYITNKQLDNYHNCQYASRNIEMRKDE